MDEGNERACWSQSVPFNMCCKRHPRRVFLVSVPFSSSTAEGPSPFPTQCFCFCFWHICETSRAVVPNLEDLTSLPTSSCSLRRLTSHPPSVPGRIFVADSSTVTAASASATAIATDPREGVAVTFPGKIDNSDPTKVPREDGGQVRTEMKVPCLG